MATMTAAGAPTDYFNPTDGGSSGTGLPADNHNNLQNYWNLYFLQDWPCVYSTLTETWTQTMGISGGPATASRTTNYSQYADEYMVVTGTAMPYIGGLVINSAAFTDTLVTINYSLGVMTGVYTAQLSGTILQPGAVGPFDPTDATYGWAALNTLALAVLADMVIPTPPSGYWAEAIWVFPTSASPGYATITATDTGGWPSGTTYGIINGSPPMTAAANGIPVQSAAGWGYSMPQGINGLASSQMCQASIADWLRPFAPVDAGGSLNEGGCCCIKSTWFLLGTNMTLGGNTNNHATKYGQSISLNATPASGVVLGSVSSGTALSGLPNFKTFNPSDAATAAGTTYGLLGFWGTAA